MIFCSILVIILGLIAPLGIILVCAMMRTCLFFREKCCSKKSPVKEETITQTCMLCNEEVALQFWDNHRRVYCPKKRDFLSFRTSESRCSKCNGRLRVVPRKYGTSFICNEVECTRSALNIKETVDVRRYNCFPCDFDRCQACVEKDIQSICDKTTLTTEHERNDSMKSHSSRKTKSSFRSSKR